LRLIPGWKIGLGAQGVEKKRPDELQDVLFPRVMRPEVAAQGRIHDRLEEGSEDRRADPAPVETAAIQKRLTHRGIEGGGGERLLEETPIHIGECREVLVKGCEPPAVRGVQNVEQGREEDPLPEEVDIPILPVDLLDLLLKGGDTAAGNPKNIEELITERLPLRILGGLVRPLPPEVAR
jgi:hypothetical protein